MMINSRRSLKKARFQVRADTPALGINQSRDAICLETTFQCMPTGRLTPSFCAVSNWLMPSALLKMIQCTPMLPLSR